MTNQKGCSKLYHILVGLFLILIAILSWTKVFIIALWASIITAILGIISLLSSFKRKECCEETCECDHPKEIKKEEEKPKTEDKKEEETEETSEIEESEE